MHTVYIKYIVTNWNMKRIFALIDDTRVDKLRDNEVLLAINTRRTMVRFVDAGYGVHTYYAPEDARVDAGRLEVIAK